MAGKSSKTKLAAEILAGLAGLVQGVGTGIQQARQNEREDRRDERANRRDEQISKSQQIQQMLAIMRYHQDSQRAKTSEELARERLSMDSDRNSRYGELQKNQQQLSENALLLRAIELQRQFGKSGYGSGGSQMGDLGTASETERAVRGTFEPGFFSLPVEEQLKRVDEERAKFTGRDLYDDPQGRDRLRGLDMYRARLIHPPQQQSVQGSAPPSLQALIQQLQGGGGLQGPPQAVPGGMPQGGPQAVPGGMPPGGSQSIPGGPQSGVPQAPIGVNPNSGTAQIVDPRVYLDSQAQMGRQHFMNAPQGPGSNGASKEVMGNIGEAYARMMAAMQTGSEQDVMAASAFLNDQLGNDQWMDVQYLLNGLPFALQSPEEMRK